MADNFVWVEHLPADKQYSWYNVTSWAEADWQVAVATYYKETWEGRDDPRKIEAANERVRWARRHYRERVLGWYRKLLLPIVPGECVPDTVAELLAEEWDERTK